MIGTLVAAAVQTAAHDRTSLEGVWPGIVRSVREAAASGARLVVLPEGTLPAYVLGYAAYDGSEIAAAMGECGRLAAELRIVLVVGAARVHDGRIFNSAVVFDTGGTVAGTADKHFLWHFDRQWFAPGERIEPVQTSIGSIGALVCADGRISTIARTLVDRGAQVLVMPTAWVTSGRDPDQLENVQADLLARVRARENGVPFIAANKCGVELESVAYCGKSQILAADGSIAAIAPQDTPAVITASIALLPARSTRAPLSELRPAQSPAQNAPARIAVAATDYSDAELENRLRVLEAQSIVMPRGISGAPFDAADVSDEQVWDPGYLAAQRLSGFDAAVWRTRAEPQWQVTFARARALELKMFVIVIDASRSRAFAVDPDGAVLCGTFGGYRIASFGYDPLRTRQTLVAPGTDVREGLERASIDAAP